MASKHSLLVADSDPRSLGIVEAALRKAGFDVRGVRDAAAARRVLEERPIELVLCDASLAGESGVALCRAVRADARLQGIPFVLTGSDASRAAKTEAIEAGADEFLPKPLLLKELVTRVRGLVERRRATSGAPPPSGLTGEVGELGLVDLFQSLEQWRRTGVVVCEAPDGRTGRVWVQDGRVIDAEVPPLAGEAAFFRLLAWDAGTFRVAFGEVDREPRIAMPTEALVLEAMRRVDELARAGDELPQAEQFHVDTAALAAKLADLPDEVNGVLRVIDGRRRLREVIERSPLDDLTTLAAIRRLVADGVLVRQPPPPAPALDAPVAPEPPPAPPETFPEPEPVELADVDAVIAVPDGVPPPVQMVRFPPLRGARRERRRREASEQRARAMNGEAVPLTSVVELPPWPADDRDARWRQISPAVSDAARKFAGDAPISRLPSTVSAVTEPPPVRGSRRVRVGIALLAAVVAVAIAGFALWPQPRTERHEARWLDAPATVTTTTAPPQPPADPYADAIQRGDASVRRGDFRAAAGEYRKAVQQRPDSVPALVALANALLEVDRPRSALRPLETALRREPRNARAQLLAGTAYQSVGRLKEAKAAYEQYLRLAPRGEYAREVRSILANLAR